MELSSESPLGGPAASLCCPPQQALGVSGLGPSRDGVASLRLEYQKHPNARGWHPNRASMDRRVDPWVAQS